MIGYTFMEDSVAEVKSFMVFNRWGESVFEHHNFEPAPRDFTFGWDGKLRGEFLNPGVFVWFAEILFTDGSTGIYKGDVTLIRNN
ncbi:MAG: gliding motility-associated C-terminal domain-containing protein [Saprospiraceae bacterium]